MLANTLPLIASQPISKTSAAAKGPLDGQSAGGDTFARELGLAQARQAAAPRPMAAQVTRPAAPPAAAPSRQAAPQAAQERAAGVQDGGGEPRPTVKDTREKKMVAQAGAPAAPSSGGRPGGTTKVTGGDKAPKDATTDPALATPGSVATPPTLADAESTPAAGLASMIASLLGAGSPAPAGEPPAQVPGGQAANTTATSTAAASAEDPASARPSAAGAVLQTGAAALAGTPGDAKPLAKDAADPAPADAAAAVPPSTADLAAAGAAAQAAGGAAPRPSAGASDTATPATVAMPLAAAGMPQAAPGAVARQDSTTAAPFDAQLAAALGSPEFAPALGHQVSLLVRGGVQEARLHLNPAEMGPITVQIALDGQTAQINLAAELPLTRQLLEQAMPALAGALREGGLTLTGGGVFEQPRDPRQDDTQAHGESRSGPAGRSEAAPAMAPAAQRTLRGAVDLIA